MDILHRSIVKENFSLSGPLHLSRAILDWSDSNHRRSVVACLVKSVWVLERDRHKKRQGDKALAPLWYQTFDFSLCKTLVDPNDSSIFGAIFKLTSSPRYVIAFRGTMLKRATMWEDLKLDYGIVKNSLHEKPRAKSAIQAVRGVIEEFGSSSSIWIAGHSLGASISLLVGKQMAEEGHFLDAYLFNPPYPSLPIEMIKSEIVINGIRTAKSVIKAGLAIAVNNNISSVASWSVWLPSLFVHPHDLISGEFVGYFNNKEHMERIGAEIITHLSMLALLMDKPSEEVLHLIPSANLTVNRTQPRSKRERIKIFMDAHDLHQWWRNDLELETTQYKYNYTQI